MANGGRQRRLATWLGAAMLACLMTPPAYASGCNFVTLASRYAAAAHVVTAIVVNEYVVNDGGFETELRDQDDGRGQGGNHTAEQMVACVQSL